MSELARRDWPVRSMHPHPESDVHPFSGQSHLGREEVTSVLEDESVWFSDVMEAVEMTGSREDREESRIGGNVFRYVSHTRDVKSE